MLRLLRSGACLVSIQVCQHANLGLRWTRGRQKQKRRRTKERALPSKQSKGGPRKRQRVGPAGPLHATPFFCSSPRASSHRHNHHASPVVFERWQGLFPSSNAVRAAEDASGNASRVFTHF